MAHELDQAEELMRKARYSDAIVRFRAVLSNDPENAQVRARCGEAYRLSGNNERAFHHYSKAAAIYQRAGDASSALRMLQLANTVSPNEPEVLFRIAETMKVLNAGHDIENVLRQIISVARGTGDRRRLWALEELLARHPEDVEVAVRRAEALTESGRIDDAVTAWKKVSASLDQRGIDFVPMLQRAAAIAPERPDVGTDLAAILMINRRAREALALLVPYYEKYPDDVGVLDMLLRALEALGATDKVTPARIELIKARAKRGMREPTLREVAVLLQAAPDDIAALEVSAHAYGAFGERAQALSLWRHLAHVCDRQSKKFERDRAILMILQANPDDEEALTLGARALREARRSDEAVVLENRLTLLKKIRDKKESRKKRTVVSTPAKAKRRPRVETNPFGAEDGLHAESGNGSGATMMLGDADVLSAKRADQSMLETLSTEEPTVPPDVLMAPSHVRATQAPPLAKNPYTADLFIEQAIQSALDAPTGRIPTPARPIEVWDEMSIESEIPEVESGIIEINDDGIAISGELSALEDVDVHLPIEGPATPEETTSRIAQLVSDELMELRAYLADPTVRAAATDNIPISKEALRSPPPEGFDTESVRPTQRLQKFNDLFENLDRAKKA